MIGRLDMGKFLELNNCFPLATSRHGSEMSRDYMQNAFIKPIDKQSALHEPETLTFPLIFWYPKWPL